MRAASRVRRFFMRTGFPFARKRQLLEDKTRRYFVGSPAGLCSLGSGRGVLNSSDSITRIAGKGFGMPHKNPPVRGRHRRVPQPLPGGDWNARAVLSRLMRGADVCSDGCGRRVHKSASDGDHRRVTRTGATVGETAGRTMRMIGDSSRNSGSVRNQRISRTIARFLTGPLHSSIRFVMEN